MALLAFASAFGAGCGVPGASPVTVEPNTVRISDGDVFENESAGLALATQWDWDLARTQTGTEVGNCNYAASPKTSDGAHWNATFSTDDQRLDPLSGARYPHGYLLVVGAETAHQVSLRPVSGAAYQCSALPDADYAAADPEPEPATAHVEMILGLEPDRVHFTGYVTRLLISRLRAPLDSVNGRPVLIAFSIPAPLWINGALESLPDGALRFHFAASSDAGAPLFEMGLETGNPALSATASIELTDLELRPVPPI